MPADTVDAKKEEVVEVGEAASAASVESSPISVGKGTPKENRDSGHESSATSTPDAERAMTPELKDGEVPEEAVYILHIELPSGDKFDVQVNNTEMLQEIHQVLLEREGTCHRTCYSLQLEGKSLDHFTEIRNVPGLKSGSTLAVVEEPYTLREARIHIRHVRDLSRMSEQGDAASAVDGMSLSYLPIVGLGEKKQEKGEKEKTFEGLPPENVLPGTKERSLSGVIPSAAIAANKSPYALKNLGLTPYNPPIPPRKMKGDVLYLFADTLEKRRVHITCCTGGFYVNGSDENTFKPTPASGQKTVVYHSLVDLIAAVSPLFKKNFTALIKKRVERPILDRLPTPYPQFAWLAPASEPIEDALRADDATQPHRVGIEEHLPGQIRDWNEELQTTGEMARTTLNERINRDRSVFKIHSDFISASVKGAQAVVEGNVMAINPADDPKTHMYIWNNIFFSLGFDVKDHYKEFGGDAAAFAATAADLQGVRAYSSVCDESKLATLGMAIIDYRGFRVTAQSIIPGILEREQEQSVVYGSIDTGKTVVSNDKYHELLDQAAKELKMLPHEVWNGKEGDEKAKVKLYTSFETKGIIGNDSRYYVLDLLRTFPPDVHYLPEFNAVSDFARENGFPHEFPHKLVAFRHELVNAFIDASYMKFVRVATYHIQMAAKEKKEKQIANGAEVQLSQEDATELNAEAMKKAAESVHSLNPNEFDIRFNPDCFSTTVKHAEEENLEAQRQLVIDCGEFLLKHQIPAFVEDLVECTVAPIDGEGLIEQMHTRGINVRYLGQIAKLAPKHIAWLRSLIGSELVVRATKHVFRGLFQSVKSGKKGGIRARASTASEWEMTSQKSLWKAICDDAAFYYNYELQVSSADALLEEWGVQKSALLRRMCRAFGIQLLAKDYNLFVAGRPIFVEDDVQNVFPVTKHREPEANDAKRLFTRGSQEMANGRLKEAYEYIAESVNLMTSVYGAMHGELAQALRSLARLSYILGDPQDALAQQHRAAIMAERCYGLDHSETITEYVNLAHMAFSNLLVPTALKLLYRARHLLLIAAGESHPFMSTIDGNIGVILFAVQEFDLACKFIQSAEKIAAAAGETKRLKSALLNHVMARAHACRGDFRTALACEKETYTIYSSLFGVEHEKTKESNETLRQLTQQAVQFQRRMQDASKGTTNLAQLLPINAQQPSLSTIIDVLNVVNGIIVFSIREPSNGEKEEGVEAVERTDKVAAIEEVKEEIKLEEETLD
ncbi:clu-1 [Pristionchus pacificus]|uniref:Clu-1 n=1 Tax=Pristionchus pacificus TaxID=54126 RepID=A0A2A6BQ33_PRIPA|nr:clu-1 [Pristionchus pacificus]|eukprot:PDM68039.1 clu-1 [Pristionchus pacificus]